MSNATIWAAGPACRREFLRRAGLAVGGLSALAAGRADDHNPKKPATHDRDQPRCEFEHPPASGRETRATPYQFPTNPRQRVRESLAVVVADASKLRRLADAYDAMKRLPESDPRNWCTQANMHYNHCSNTPPNNGYYLKIHGNSSFFPWHRAYLFFYEGILGQLIGDDSFALPYWDWGRIPVVPDPFFDSNSSLYDPNRAIVRGQSILDDSDYGPMVDEGYVNGLVTGVSRQPLADFQSGVEPGPHGAGHLWVGGGSNADMGIFETAARDILFFAHHANIDRLWTLWRAISGHTEPTSDDWRNRWYNCWDPADSGGRMVSVTTADVLDPTKVSIGYATHAREVVLTADRHELTGRPYHTDPVAVDSVLRRVTEPDGPRLRLVIAGVEAPHDAAVLLRVFVNYPDATADSRLDERFAGTLFLVPANRPEPGHAMSHPPQDMSLLVSHRLAPLLNKLRGEKPQDQKLTVTLVPLTPDKKPSDVKVRFRSIRLVAEDD